MSTRAWVLVLSLVLLLKFSSVIRATGSEGFNNGIFIKTLHTKFNHTERHQVNKSRPLEFKFDLKDIPKAKLPLSRISLNIEVVPEEHTLLGCNDSSTQIFFYLRGPSSFSLVLPFAFDPDNSDRNGRKIDSNCKGYYFATNKTICMFDAIPRDKIELTIMTPSERNLTAIFTLRQTMDMILRVSKNAIETSVSPTSGTFYQIMFDDTEKKDEKLEVLTESLGEGKNICTVIAVDKFKCPVYDTESSYSRNMEFKHMTTQAVSRIKQSNRYKTGFVLSIIPLSNDKECFDDNIGESACNSSESRNKDIKIIVRTAPSINLFVILTIVLGGSIVFASSFGAIEYFCFKGLLSNDAISNYICLSNPDEAENPRTTNNVENSNEDFNQNTEEHQEKWPITYKERLERFIEPRRPPTPAFSPNEPNQEETFQIFNLKHHKFTGIMVLIAAFYIVPAVQYITYLPQSMKTSGNYDMCYFNELCRISVFGIGDVNHFISNFSYIIFGLIFIIIVYNRSRQLKVSTGFGIGLIPQYDAYIALGLSLILEGVLSIIYHVCPNKQTFQFDSTFMYVISIIVITIIHQKRRFPTPNGTPAFLAIVILLIIPLGMKVLTGLGLNSLVQAMSDVGIILISLWYSFWTYLDGIIQTKWEFTWKSFKTLWNIRMKVVLSLTRFGIDIFIVIYGFYDLHLGFSRLILMILIANVFYQFSVYLIWKLRYAEFCSFYIIKPITYFALGILCFVYAKNEFSINLTEWNATPAVSRSYNQPCLVGPFDHHDLWHFLSASALFLFFMTILTVDDGISKKSRDQILSF